MKNNPTQKNRFDLSKLQKSYFEASVDNVLQANDAIKSAQNWLLILGLAEMSFLGAILVQSKEPSLSIKYILSILLIGFVLFLMGSVKQYKHLLKSARYYKNLSSMILSDIEKNGNLVNEIPNEFKEESQIRSDKITNVLIFSSFVLILISTFAIIFLIFTHAS